MFTLFIIGYNSIYRFYILLRVFFIALYNTAVDDTTFCFLKSPENDMVYISCIGVCIPNKICASQFFMGLKFPRSWRLDQLKSKSQYSPDFKKIMLNVSDLQLRFEATI